MQIVEFIIRLIVFSVGLFVALEFITTCEFDTWKSATIFMIMSIIVIILFFTTKQHLTSRCTQCKYKITPLRLRMATKK